jgi:hypothetical protein
MRRQWALDPLAVAAVGAQGVFTVSWMVGGLLQRGYSFDAQYISELAGHPTAHPWIVQAGIALWGAGFFALAGAAWLGLRPRPARTWIAVLLALLGVAAICEAFFQLDCYTSISVACRRAARAGDLSWHHYAHEWLAFVLQPVPSIVALLVARVLWPHRLAWLPIAGAVFGLLLFGAAIVADTGEPTALPKHAGVAQRSGILALNGGAVLLALGLMLVPRFEPRRPVVQRVRGVQAS